MKINKQELVMAREELYTNKHPRSPIKHGTG